MFPVEATRHCVVESLHDEKDNGNIRDFIGSGSKWTFEPYNADEKDGDGDKRVQAYNFRMCLTDNPSNRIPFKKPATYDEREYELLLRNFEKGERSVPWINSKMPNRKTDTNNRLGFSTDFIGRNYEWPEASYARRAEIFKTHLDYQKGLMWTLANHPRVPSKIRAEVSRWGTCKDEFLDGSGDGWQSLPFRTSRTATFANASSPTGK